MEYTTLIPVFIGSIILFALGRIIGYNIMRELSKPKN
jgi:membrane protein DedA with SNARE-associated domain